jgi:prepilin-type N-terminal cleavage/methylation domain-containing protein
MIVAFTATGVGPAPAKHHQHTQHFVMRRSSRGFTLIELLIVVGIIAILAAIAIPNLLEAQIRAKVSRVRSELRSLATGLEAYAVDNRAYPFDGDHTGGPEVGWMTSFVYLTTPIAYITSVPADQFQDPASYSFPPVICDVDYPNHTHCYRYDTRFYWTTGPYADKERVWVASYGESKWKVNSAGPDRRLLPQSELFLTGKSNRYDPTNGTISSGDIFRTQALMQ